MSFPFYIFVQLRQVQTNSNLVIRLGNYNHTHTPVTCLSNFCNYFLLLHSFQFTFNFGHEGNRNPSGNTDGKWLCILLQLNSVALFNQTQPVKQFRKTFYNLFLVPLYQFQTKGSTSLEPVFLITVIATLLQHELSFDSRSPFWMVTSHYFQRITARSNKRHSSFTQRTIIVERIWDYRNISPGINLKCNIARIHLHTGRLRPGSGC